MMHEFALSKVGVRKLICVSESLFSSNIELEPPPPPIYYQINQRVKGIISTEKQHCAMIQTYCGSSNLKADNRYYYNQIASDSIRDKWKYLIAKNLQKFKKQQVVKTADITAMLMKMEVHIYIKTRVVKCNSLIIFSTCCKIIAVSHAPNHSFLLLALFIVATLS